MATSVLENLDRLKDELDALRPLPSDVVARVEQKLRIESNYHSNAVEGNSLTLGETRSLILHGLTARGKPMRDHLDIQGHDDAVKAIERAVQEDTGLTEVFIRNLHRILLKEPYESETVTPDGLRTMRPIALGDYKTTPNNVKTSTGEIYYFTPPEQVKPAMTDLLDWYRARETASEHPIIIAATFHYRFVRIHPFDDGNGRMARLLMNLILIKHGYTVAIVQRDERASYLQELERADQSEDPTQFIEYVASCCVYALDLYLRAARGESIDDPEDIDQEIALFRRSVVKSPRSVNHIPLRQYVEAVAQPLFEYFESKIESITSELFTKVPEPSVLVAGTGTDGRTFHEDLRGNSGLKADVVPEQVLQGSIGFLFEAQRFQDTEKTLCYHVATTLDANETTWIFRVLVGGHWHTLDKHQCVDVNDVKMRFNELLRYSMQVMHQWGAEEE
jgi:Fic family protein